MEREMVSVIVPVYNVEKYLDRCITSIVNQTYLNLEIILVDDGSPDRSPQICEEWARRDSRIRIIHKTNGGLGMARNTGMDNAHGAYVCFVDSDDYIAEDTVQKAYTLITAERADVVVCGFYSVDSTGNTVDCFIPRVSKSIYAGEEVQHEFIPALLGADPNSRNKRLVLAKSLCTTFFSKALIDRTGWRCVSEREIISEDAYSWLLLGKHIRKAAVLHEALYYYCFNAISLSHTYREDRYEKIRQFYLKSVELCEAMDYPKIVVTQCSEPYISYTIATLKQIADNYPQISINANYISAIASDDVLQKVLREKSKERKNFSRGVLFWSLRHRMWLLTYILVKIQLFKERTRRKC